LSPVRHFVVTKNAGGFVLGAFDGDQLAGFVLSVPAFLRGEKAFYSHMTGVRPQYQSTGIGAELKWAQRGRALELGVRYLKWTFEPVKARNAYFNLEKLGAVIHQFMPNFYGTDYASAPRGLASDRLFAEWHLGSPEVEKLAAEGGRDEPGPADETVVIMNDWSGLVDSDIEAALSEQRRIRAEFESAFARGLVAKRFRRDEAAPAFLLYSE